MDYSDVWPFTSSLVSGCISVLTVFPEVLLAHATKQNEYRTLYQRFLSCLLARRPAFKSTRSSKTFESGCCRFWLHERTETNYITISPGLFKHFYFAEQHPSLDRAVWRGFQSQSQSLHEIRLPWKGFLDQEHLPCAAEYQSCLWNAVAVLAPHTWLIRHNIVACCGQVVEVWGVVSPSEMQEQSFVVSEGTKGFLRATSLLELLCNFGNSRASAATRSDSEGQASYYQHFHICSYLYP